MIYWTSCKALEIGYSVIVPMSYIYTHLIVCVSVLRKENGNSIAVRKVQVLAVTYIYVYVIYV